MFVTKARHVMDLTNELELATDLARRAGDEIQRVRAHAMPSSTTKADKSPVTEADLRADAIIREGLLPVILRTGDSIVTEETWAGSLMGAAARRWIVDPLDGTEEFVAGRADYCVQIGLVVGDAPVLGVVYQPTTGVVWRGVVGRGAERIDATGTRALSVGARALRAAPRIAVSVSHPSEIVTFVTTKLHGVVIPRGSVGLKVGLIVDDEADAYFTASRRIKVWDTCAPAAIFLAAGGLVTSLGGALLSYTQAAAHDDGALFWIPDAKAKLSPAVDAAVAEYRARRPR